MFKAVKKAAFKQGMKLMSNPKVTKMMTDPRVMKMMMQAFQLKGTIQREMDVATARLASLFHLATREEVEKLQNTVHDLESEIASLEQELAARQHDAE